MFSSGKLGYPYFGYSGFDGFWKENSEWAYLKIPMRWKVKELHALVMQEADRNTSLRSARESMVLLKNDGVLPIAAKGKKSR